MLAALLQPEVTTPLGFSNTDSLAELKDADIREGRYKRD
jgi:hypothetical protein